MAGADRGDKGQGGGARARGPRRESGVAAETGVKLERLQKVLAARGVASRRAAEELILEGRITVNGRVVTELGTKVDPENASIKIGGRLLKQPRLVYLLLNKPRGYITTVSDPEGRRTIYDLLDTQAKHERIYPVGRLDMDSEGLLLLTNDGELANRITHPRYRIDKEYNALVQGSPSPGTIARLAQGGFMVDGGRTSPAEVAIIGHDDGGTWLKVIIHEGRKRQVRRMMEEVGHPVRRLRRVRLGPLTLAGLPAAAYRPLGPDELARLRRMIGLGSQEAPEADAPARQPVERPTPTPRPSAERRTPSRAADAGRTRAPQGRPGGTRGKGDEQRGTGPERTGGPSTGRGGPRRDTRGGGTGGTGGRGGRKPGGDGQRRTRP